MKRKLLMLSNVLRFRAFGFLKYIFYKKRRAQIKDQAQAYFYNLPAISFDDWAKNIDSSIYIEMKEFQKEFRSYEKTFDFSPLGGGRGLNQFGALFYLTRLIKPSYILETGVASGYSSYSFLYGININRKGHLISNDLPPLDVKKEKWKYIGQMVPDNLRMFWELHLGSDKNNLKKLCKNYNFELAHFDSDKTKSGKMFCINTLLNNNTKPPFILIDNCADDFFWKDLDIDSYKKVVFEQEGKRFGALIHVNDLHQYSL